jgi:hypothetical protein
MRAMIDIDFILRILISKTSWPSPETEGSSGISSSQSAHKSVVTIGTSRD